MNPWDSIVHKKDVKQPQTFVMYRGGDETGVSGTGPVLEGIIFSDGRVSIRWFTAGGSIGIYNSFADFWRIHVESHPSNKTQVFYSNGAVRAQ